MTASSARIIVVGLGPGGADLTLVAARNALLATEHRYVRTTRHPAVDDLVAEGLTFQSFDEVYERAESFDAVYGEIADTLLAAAREYGTIAYGVPGSPMLAERTVQGLLARATTTDVAVELIPGLSFADLSWARVGIDEMERGRILDGHRFAADAVGASGPVLIAQVDDMFIASDVKLALLDVLAEDAPVTILQRLGLPDEFVDTVPLEELDRVLQPDHLTSIFVDLGDATVGAAMVDLMALATQLRAPGGCPWDAEQTHHSLAKHVIEEAHEVAEAIDALPTDAPGGEIEIGAYDELEEELGDLLYQVVFHSILAQEAGAFTFDDVARGIHEKLVRRHPHVFGDVEVASTDEVVANWAAIKRDEGKTSAFSGMPASLPALLYAQKLVRKAEGLGVSLDMLLAASTPKAGAALAALAGADERDGVDAEAALRTWNLQMRDRLMAFEAALAERGLDPRTLDAAVAADHWDAQGKHG